MIDETLSNDELIDRLRDAVIRGIPDEAITLTEEAVSRGIDPVVVFEEGLRKPIAELGEDFACGNAYLPDLVIGADAVKAAAAILEEEIAKIGGDRQSLGKVVIGTVSGDIHDIGKSIVGTMLTAQGFEVVDLGVNVATEAFVEAVRENRPAVLGMSSLLTITAKELGKVIDGLEEAGIRDSVKVIVGGGAVTDAYAKEIGADAYGHDAGHGVRTVKELLGIE